MAHFGIFLFKTIKYLGSVFCDLNGHAHLNTDQCQISGS